MPELIFNVPPLHLVGAACPAGQAGEYSSWIAKCNTLQQPDQVHRTKKNPLLGGVCGSLFARKRGGSARAEHPRPDNNFVVAPIFATNVNNLKFCRLLVMYRCFSLLNMPTTCCNKLYD